MIEDDPEYVEYHFVLWEAEFDELPGAPALADDKAWWFINSTLWDRELME